MKQTVCIFEDPGYINFQPLTYFRPVYELKCGIFSLRRKIEKLFANAEIVLHSRNYLEDYAKTEYGLPVNDFDIKADSVIFINGRILADQQFKKDILKKKNTVYIKGGVPAAAHFTRENFNPSVFRGAETIGISHFENLEKAEINAVLLNYPWELVNRNGAEILSDYGMLVKSKKKKIDPKDFPGVYFINKKNIFIEKGVQIKPFTVLDASDGPVYIDKNALLMPHVSVQGPVYIGENSTLKMHSAIYHDTTIGKFCKVGGEVEASILHSYSNKQHDGFLGHSYLGSWVNLGAGTNNSDLKNNYSNITVLINNRPVDSGSMFAGLVMGDHSKTAINTNFNTGTVVGVSSNIFGAGFPHRYIPSFSWGGSEIMKTYSLEKAVEVAKIVMSRRGKNFGGHDYELFKHVFELTANERKLRK